MMDTPDLQQQFFNYLKSNLPPHLSLVDELVDLLDLSSDSVYRRIRGEKPITLPELKKICERYKISLDQVLQLQNESVVFQAPEINQLSNDFEDYLRKMCSMIKSFNSFHERRMLYFCKDMIFFHFYLFPEIAAFKTFFWVKTIKNYPEYNNKTFSLAEYPFTECFTIGQEIIKEYNNIPSLELWNVESINSTISQVQYYKDAGIFRSDADFEAVVDSFEKCLDHLQLQAEKGVKFMPGASDLAYKSPLQFYVNEVVLGTNTIFVELDGLKHSILTYNVLSYLITKDPRFNAHSFANFHTLVSRSTLISGTGEKERHKFFKYLKDKLQQLRK